MLNIFLNCFNRMLVLVLLCGTTTGKRAYADGQSYAYGCRRPSSTYADSPVLAVGLNWPSGYMDLCRRLPSAQNGHRPSRRHADSSRRHR